MGRRILGAMRRTATSLVALALLLAGCSGDAPAPGSPAPEKLPGLAEYDATGVAVARSPFCDRIPAQAVRDALGDAAEESTAYGNGEPAELTDGVTDVAHEFGCSFRAANGMTARAWLFAPPVTPGRARLLVKESLGEGCSVAEDIDFGSPSVATRCGGDGEIEEGYRGLFGDAWLSCTLGSTGREQPDDLTERTDRWCVQVLEAARVR